MGEMSNVLENMCVLNSHQWSQTVTSGLKQLPVDSNSHKLSRTVDSGVKQLTVESNYDQWSQIVAIGVTSAVKQSPVELKACATYKSRPKH